MDLCVLPRPIEAPSRSLVIAAGGGRDLAWPHQRIAAELLARSGGRLVHLLLHGGARGADAAIARAAHQLGWSSLVMPAHRSPGSIASVLVVAFPGGAGTASLVQQARRLAFRSPVPIAVVEVSPSAGLWAVPSPELPPGA
jgi:hypothetical protein